MIRACLVLFLLLALDARAEFFDGHDLLQRCQASNAFDSGACMGYVAGVHDAISGVVICPESHSGRKTLGQVRDLVVQYLHRNPQLRGETADVLIRAALMPVWPCRNSSSPPAPTTRNF